MEKFYGFALFLPLRGQHGEVDFFAEAVRLTQTGGSLNGLHLFEMLKKA